jgi:hypothetical protein
MTMALVAPEIEQAPDSQNQVVARMARRLAEALEHLRASDLDVGLARGLAWTLSDLLEKLEL